MKALLIFLGVILLVSVTAYYSLWPQMLKAVLAFAILIGVAKLTQPFIPDE